MDAKDAIELLIEDVERRYCDFPSRLSVVGCPEYIQQGVISGLREIHPDSRIDSEVRGARGVVLPNLLRKYVPSYYGSVLF